MGRIICLRDAFPSRNEEDHPLRSVNSALCLLWLFRLFLSIFLLFHLYIYFWQGLERSATEHRKTGNKRVTTANQKKGRYLRF